LSLKAEAVSALSKGNFTGAENKFKQALMILKQSHPSGHPDITTIEKSINFIQNKAKSRDNVLSQKRR